MKRAGGRRAATARLLPGALGGLILAGCQAQADALLPQGGPAFEARSVPSPCQPIAFEETPFILCIARAGHQQGAMDGAAQGASGAADLPSSPQAQPPDPGGAQMGQMGGRMRAGFCLDAAGRPGGCLESKGQRGAAQRALLDETRSLPGGVLLGPAHGPWQVLASGDLPADLAASGARGERLTARSGLLLVQEGEIPATIAPDGPDLARRSAAGIDAAGRVLFVVSEAPVSLGRLARLYRDVLKASEALLLNGAPGQIWAPADGRLDQGRAIGPLIGKKNRAEAGT